MPRSVLIPVDGSDNSRRAFDFYLSDVRQADDTIIFCHVQSTPHLASFNISEPLNFPTEEWTSQIQENIKKSQKVVTHYEMLCEEKKMNKKVTIFYEVLWDPLNSRKIYFFYIPQYTNDISSFHKSRTMVVLTISRTKRPA